MPALALGLANEKRLDNQAIISYAGRAMGNSGDNIG
jgi:hypothetical protein